MIRSMDSVQNSDVLCIIPAKNESEVIGAVVKSLVTNGYQVLCVDDGSTDGTGSVAALHGAMVLTHPINLGQGAALESGFEAVRKRYVHSKLIATFDADGQHSVDDLRAMVDVFNRDADLMVILGSRFLGIPNDVPRLKRVLLRISAAIAKLTIGLKVTDRNNGLRLFRVQAVDRFQLKIPGFGHADEILRVIKRQSFQYMEVPVHILYTDYSKSKGQPLMNAVRIVFDQMLGNE
jgi:glycosyltransferase involved in cell wall biosynthesis